MATMPPPGPMPPPSGGGGGLPIAQVLQGLMQNPQQLQQMMGVLAQDPVAVQGMQAFMQGGGAPGGDPRAALASRGAVGPGGMAIPDPRSLANRGSGQGPATDSELFETAEANQGIRGNLPPLADIGGYTGYGEEMTPMPETRQTPEPEQDKNEADEQEEAGDYVNRESADAQEEAGDYGDRAEKMATDQIDKAGHTFDGVDAPSGGDIKRLLADPSMAEAFNAQFGRGMAERYLSPSGDQEGAQPTR